MFSFVVHAQAPPTLSQVEDVFGNFLGAVFPLFGVILLIVFILAGITIITSGTNAGKLEQGKKTLTYAIAGLLFAALSYLIIWLISRYTGNTRILEFNICLPGRAC